MSESLRVRPLIVMAMAWAIGLVSTALWPSVRVLTAAEAYRIDATKSRVTIAVGKAGAFSFMAGHTHEVSGPIEDGAIAFDPDDPSRSQIHLSIAAAALKVSGANEPPDDRPKVQATMEGANVLDVARYPHIAFRSSRVTVKQRENGALEVVVAGDLTIRGVTQPITAPVHVTLAGSRLTADGRFAVKQTVFGMKPVSVGGVVAVKDTLDITFSIAAQR
jgi:polyisoprenoid-binding protein YceI